MRPGTAADGAAVARLIADVAGERRWLATQPPVDLAWRAQRFAAALDEGRAVSFVAVDGERVVGELTLSLREGLNLGMCVARDYRGCGLGRALLDAAIACAADLGLPQILLDVYAHNDAARRLYASRGFVATGEVEEVEREGEMWQVLTMRRPVASAS